MRIGIGLPTTIAGAPAGLLVPWARAAEAGPFSSLAVHDRLAYDALDPLSALAVAAAVTERIRLAALVVIAPIRPAALLARQAASVQRLSAGRLVLGLGIGPRRDDYRLAGVPYPARGRILDRQLARLPGLWDGHPPRLLLGGVSDRALLRMARHASGFVHSGGPPRAFRNAAVRALVAWSEAGRPGRPELWGLGYFALGPGAVERGRAQLLDYYGFSGGFATRIAAGLLASREEIGAFARAYAEAGCDELVLFPTVAELDQVHRLADAVERI
ncbi:MAG TPA: LLM class flavin-dependent oxidoreductase [Candidatus Dormibacteraeota bacterium]|nr:LLM class flavin-dependent oxidoreductase [Candidatus Dormibacteraeota bacterium]